MKHINAIDFNRFIDNELSLQEKEAVQKHFAECDSCSMELQGLTFVNSLLIEQREEKAPEEVETLVMKKIVRKIKNDKSQKTLFGFIISLFSLGIFSVVGFAAYEVAGKVFPQSINSEITKRFAETSGQIKSFISVLFGEKTLQSFEVAVLLFFVLSLYFIIEKYKTIRH